MNPVAGKSKTIFDNEGNRTILKQKNQPLLGLRSTIIQLEKDPQTICSLVYLSTVA